MSKMTPRQPDTGDKDTSSSFTAMVECENCGAQVPQQNVALHQAMACQGRKRRAVPVNHERTDTDETTAPVPQSPARPVAAVAAAATASPPPSRPNASRSLHNNDSNNASLKRRASRIEQPAAAAHVDLTNLPASPQTARATRAASHNSVDIMDSSDEESTNDDNRRPAARQRAGNDVIDLMDDDEDGGDAQWTCSRCTLINPVSSVNCEACNARNPAASPRAPDPVRRERLIGGDDDDDWMGAMHHHQRFMHSTRAGRGPSARNSNNNNNNSAAFLGGGAIMGGLLGGAAAYARGMPMSSGVLGGAMQGAVGGALMNEMLQNSGSTGRQQQQQQQPARGRRATTRTVRRANGMTTTTTTWSSSSSSRASRNPRLLDPVAEMMLQSALATSPRRFAGAGGGSIDGMSYEQLLNRFGDGSEMMGASDAQVASLPVATVNETTSLPEDSRQCSICLENFNSGDKRMILPCLHSFHEACCNKWLKKNFSCPSCRNKV